MTWILGLTGLGLAFLPPVRTGRRRLAALVGTRLPAAKPGVGLPLRLPLRWWGIGAGTSLVAGTAVSAGPVPAGLIALSGAAVWSVWRQLSRERQSVADQERLTGVVSALVAEHAAGAALPVALSTVAADAGPWQPAFLRSGRAAALGGEPAAELATESRLAPLAVAVGLADRTGIALAEVLARVRDEVSTERANRRAVSEAVAGPRSSALLLALLPVIGLVLGAALGARPLQILTRTPAGLLCLVVGVVLDLAGLLWTLRLTR